MIREMILRVRSEDGAATLFGRWLQSTGFSLAVLEN